MSFRRALLATTALFVACSAAHPQSLYGSDPASGSVTELSLLPTPAFCGGPSAKFLSGFKTDGAAPPCPGLPPLPPISAFAGDVAIDKTSDTVYVSDGVTIASYTSSGALITSFTSPLPGPLSGMCFEPGLAADTLWITDGTTVMSVTPPPAPACLAPVVPTSSFAVPIGPGLFSAPLTDLDVDPFLGPAGAFVACDAAGTLGSFLFGGAPGPLGFSTLLPATCPLAPPFTGLAIDDAKPGTGTVYVTDGAVAAYVDLSALLPPAPGAPSFYTPSDCTPLIGPPLAGLAFAARPLVYGPATGVPSEVGSLGQSYTGNPSFELTLTSAPGNVATLFFGGGGPACPPLPLLGLAALILPPYLDLATVVVPAGGTAFLPAALPPATPGLALDLQWLLFAPATGALGTSAGLHLTITAP